MSPGTMRPYSPIIHSFPGLGTNACNQSGFLQRPWDRPPRGNRTLPKRLALICSDRKGFFIRARVSTTWPPWGEPRGLRTRTEHTTRGDESSFSGGSLLPGTVQVPPCAARASPDTGLLHTRGQGKVWVHPEGALVAPGLTPITCTPAGFSPGLPPRLLASLVKH